MLPPRLHNNSAIRWGNLQVDKKRDVVASVVASKLDFSEERSLLTPTFGQLNLQTGDIRLAQIADFGMGYLENRLAH